MSWAYVYFKPKVIIIMITVNDCNFKHFFFLLISRGEYELACEDVKPMERGGGRSVEQSMERKQLWNKWDNQKVRLGYNFSSLIVFFNSIALPYVYNYIHIVIIFCI